MGFLEAGTGVEEEGQNLGGKGDRCGLCVGNAVAL